MTEDNFEDNLEELLALKLINIGARHYRLLKMLPTNINDIVATLKTNRVKANKYVNELEKICLVTRRRGSGKVFPTEYTEIVLCGIEEFKEVVKNKTIVYFKNLNEMESENWKVSPAMLNNVVKDLNELETEIGRLKGRKYVQKSVVVSLQRDIKRIRHKLARAVRKEKVKRGSDNIELILGHYKLEE